MQNRLHALNCQSIYLNFDFIKFSIEDFWSVTTIEISVDVDFNVS